MRDEQQSLMTPNDMSKRYVEIIPRNFQRLLDATKTSQSELCKKLEKKGLLVNQGTISKYLEGNVRMQFSVIVNLCEIFSISISDFVREDFKYIDDKISTKPLDTRYLNPDDAALYIPKLGRNFISNPNDLAFQGYIQDYHCYFFPTLSREKDILTGELKLEKRDSICEATFELNTNRKKDGEFIRKTYSGCAIISTTVDACYVILSSPEEGEICVVNFRHFFIRHESLECRIAEVITSGAGEGHPPTVHRMLISKSKIEDEHLRFIAPHLHLNRGEIQISKKEMDALRKEGDKYDELIEHLLKAVDPIEMYLVKEDYVRGNAKQFLESREVGIFLSKLRERSLKTRYNKASARADESLRRLMLDLGYFSTGNLKEE